MANKRQEHQKLTQLVVKLVDTIHKMEYRIAGLEREVGRFQKAFADAQEHLNPTPKRLKIRKDDIDALILEESNGAKPDLSVVE